MKQRLQKNGGFVLVTTLFMMAVLISLIGAYFVTNRVEIATTLATANSANGFYAAEAGLNLRAQGIRDVFVGYNVPSGTSPAEASACEPGHMGSGDFICRNYTLGHQDATTYVVEEPGNPQTLPIPPGERYENLNSQQYWYTIKSKGLNSRDETEALLELRFKSVLVPMFQFLAFYDKDLEILPGATATFSGPIHTNGDLYFNTDAAGGIQVNGQVTAADDIYRGRKDNRGCNANPVSVHDRSSYRTLPSCSGLRRVLTQSDLNPYNGRIQRQVPPVTVPGPEIFDPNASGLYWSKADLRLALHLTAANGIDTSSNPTGVEVRNVNGTLDDPKSDALATCSGAANGKAANSATLYNGRENKSMILLDIDIIKLLDCLRANNWFGTGKRLDDSTEGGLVFHFTVFGPDSGLAANRYGIRVRNGARLQATAGSPAVRGMTVVSDQSMYVLGNYNSTNKIPAALMGDSLNILSNAWVDSDCQCSLASPTPNTCNSESPLRCPWARRNVSATTVNAAILSGTDTTGGIEGPGGQNGAYNGGLENMPRFLEDWNGADFNYTGSWVSLTRPRHVNGAWPGTGTPHYSPPRRNWAYDTSFNNAANLPPLTPRFVYLRQELFVRDYQRDS